MGIGALIESISFRIRLIKIVVCSTNCFKLESKLALILRARHPLVINLSRDFESRLSKFARLLLNS